MRSSECPNRACSDLLWISTDFKHIFKQEFLTQQNDKTQQFKTNLVPVRHNLGPFNFVEPFVRLLHLVLGQMASLESELTNGC